MQKIVLVDKKSSGKMYVEKLYLSTGDTESFRNENDSFYFVISGYGFMSVESYDYNFEPETSFFVPKNSEYSFSNTGEIDLVLVCYSTK